MTKMKIYNIVCFELPEIGIPAEYVFWNRWDETEDYTQKKYVPKDTKNVELPNVLEGIEIEVHPVLANWVSLKMKVLFRPETEFENKLLLDIERRSRDTINVFLKQYKTPLFEFLSTIFSEYVDTLDFWECYSINEVFNSDNSCSDFGSVRKEDEKRLFELLDRTNDLWKIYTPPKSNPIKLRKR